MKINYYTLPEIKERNVEVKFTGVGKRGIIIETVCEWYDVAPEKLNTKSRLMKFLVPRQVCMYFLRQHTTMTLKEIGASFGHRDHTTAVSSVKKIKGYIKIYDEFENDINAIELKIIQKMFNTNTK